MSRNWLLLISVAAVLLPVIVLFTVLRTGKTARLLRGGASAAKEPRAADRTGFQQSFQETGFQQSSQESREEFVRRHWQRSGVVANGVTLVDLYDRIRALEARVARAEQGSVPPPPD